MESGKENPYSCCVLAGARSMHERRSALQVRVVLKRDHAAPHACLVRPASVYWCAKGCRKQAISSSENRLSIKSTLDVMCRRSRMATCDS